MRATLIRRAPGSRIGAWSVKFRGVSHEVLANTAIDAWNLILDTYGIEA